MKCIEEDGSVKCAPALKREKEKSAREYAAEEFKFQTGQYERALRDLIAAAETARGDLAPVAQSILDGKPYLDQYQILISIRDSLDPAVAAAKKVLGEE